jgi:hypothetical protein
MVESKVCPSTVAMMPTGSVSPLFFYHSPCPWNSQGKSVYISAIDKLYEEATFFSFPLQLYVL